MLSTITAVAYLYTSLAFTCPHAEVINKTEGWTRHDSLALNRAFITCNDVYEACLKTFIKQEERTYRAICKKPARSDNLRR